jgi:hypothetical protein
MGEESKENEGVPEEIGEAWIIITDKKLQGIKAERGGEIKRITK